MEKRKIRHHLNNKRIRGGYDLGKVLERIMVSRASKEEMTCHRPLENKGGG